MKNVSYHKLGVVLGGFLALFHAIWALLVLTGVAKPLLDWILGMHFLNFTYSIDPFSLGKALMLVIITGVVGYLCGLIIGWLWNLAHKASH